MANRSTLPPQHRPSPPPEVWRPARAVVRRAIAPVERFLQIEAASGILLLIAAAIALVWANSDWADSYHALWHAPIGISVGSWSFSRDVHFWVNDGIMAIFFFVVGLEIRREIHQGELSELKRATLPLFAALGGVLAPALIYAAFNWGHPSIIGWGVPMATDIAFAVGILTLLGNRVAPALRILLLALAVIDDVLAILVIAIFYSAGVDGAGLLVAALGMVGMVGFKRLGVRSPWTYALPGLVLWAGLYAGGIHPTLAGVIAGLLTPVGVWLGPEGFAVQARTTLERLDLLSGPDSGQLAMTPQERELEIYGDIAALSKVSGEALSPVERLIHGLHGWVAFAIMPLFALANAGVPLGNASFDETGMRIFLGITIGLAVGKPLGILLLSRLVGAMGILALPRGVAWSHASVVGIVAGVGFTMALFIAQLAFPSGAMLETAKLAVLCGSAIAAIIGLVAGRWLLPAASVAHAASTVHAAESSTED